MNRKERRNLKKDINIFSDVINILKQYFPKLVDKFEKLTDTRHKSYIEYQMSVITITRLLGLLCGIKSMRNTTEKLNTEETIKNISNLLDIELEEIPHYDTINNVFENIEIEELRKIPKDGNREEEIYINKKFNLYFCKHYMVLAFPCCMC